MTDPVEPDPHRHAGQRPAPRTRTRIVVLAVALVVIVVELMGAIAYSALVPAMRRERLELMLGERSTWRNTALRYRAHPFLQYTGDPAFVDPSGHRTFGEDGFRREPSRAHDPALRVVVMGGSTTYGLFAATTEEAWPAMLERALAREGLDVAVKNVGLPSYTSWHLVAAASFFIRAWRPDVVILHTGFNDGFARAYEHEGESDARTVLKPYTVATLSSLESFVLRLSRTARVVWLPLLAREGRLAGDLTDAMFHRAPSSSDAIAARAAGARGATFADNIETLFALGSSVGARVVVMPVPLADDGDVERPPFFEAAFAGARQNGDILVERAGVHGHAVIDLRSQFRAHGDFVDDVHMTDESEARRVELMVPLLRPLLDARLDEKARSASPSR